MTVKCLPSEDKQAVCSRFRASPNSITINRLAYETGTSRRTIIRVLEDHGIDAGVKPRKPKVVVQEDSFYDYGQQYVDDFANTIPGDSGFSLEVEPITAVYKPTVTIKEAKPWWKRLLESFMKSAADSSTIFRG